MAGGLYADIDTAMQVSNGLKAKKNTPEEIAAVTRVICGARSCEGPEHALEVFDMLGITPARELKESA